MKKARGTIGSSQYALGNVTRAITQYIATGESACGTAPWHRVFVHSVRGSKRRMLEALDMLSYTAGGCGGTGCTQEHRIKLWGCHRLRKTFAGQCFYLVIKLGRNTYVNARVDIVAINVRNGPKNPGSYSWRHSVIVDCDVSFIEVEHSRKVSAPAAVKKPAKPNLTERTIREAIDSNQRALVFAIDNGLTGTRARLMKVDAHLREALTLVHG